MDKTIAIRIDPAFHRRVKIRSAENGMTLKEYIVCLIESDLKDSNPLNFDNIATDTIVSEESVKEAQKILDFVSSLLVSQEK